MFVKQLRKFVIGKENTIKIRFYQCFLKDVLIIYKLKNTLPLYDLVSYETFMHK